MKFLHRDQLPCVCRQDICCVSRQRHVLCELTRHLRSPKTSPPHCPHRGNREAAAPVSTIPGGCLGRPQMSCLLTQQMSCLLTRQMSCLQTQQMSCLQTSYLGLLALRLDQLPWPNGQKQFSHWKIGIPARSGRLTCMRRA